MENTKVTRRLTFVKQTCCEVDGASSGEPWPAPLFFMSSISWSNSSFSLSSRATVNLYRRIKHS